MHDMDVAEFWLEVLLTLKYGPGTAAHQLHIEAQELRAMLSAVQLARTDGRGFAMAPALEFVRSTSPDGPITP